MPTPGIAANAYAQLSRITDAVGGISKTVGDQPDKHGPDFGALLKEAIDGVGAAGRKSDAQAQAMATGKANIIDVVTAVSESEVAVGALVSVRDKVIQAYQSIMQMPI